MEFFTNEKCICTLERVGTSRRVACGYKVLEASSTLHYYGGSKIKHFSHKHWLFPRDEMKKDEDERCSACTQRISNSPSYGCKQCESYDCKYILHKSCAELPQRIRHPFHPQKRGRPEHPLTLHHQNPYDRNKKKGKKTPYDQEVLKGRCICDACGKYCFGFVYHCASCNFDLHIGCASLVPNISYEGHNHLLTLFENVKDNPLCDSCAAPCPTLVLHCVHCNFNIHKSCADGSYTELPKEIQHPFHRLHPLTLNDHPQQSLWCDACDIWIDNFSFCCEECDFILCIECTSLAPTIKYEGHEHLLTLFSNMYRICRCNSCHGICKAFIFRCVECNLNLHPQCLPSFPRTIKHKCHIDPLTFTYSFMEEDDDSDEEFYCDVCETKRNPEHPVYYCAECRFVAEISCVISEVLPSLEGNSVLTPPDGGVELHTSKTLVNEVASEVLSEASVVKLGGMGQKGSEHGSKACAKDAETNPYFSVGNFSHTSSGVEVLATGGFATVTNENVGVGTAANPDLDKLDEEISKLQVELEALGARLLEGLKNKRTKRKGMNA